MADTVLEKDPATRAGKERFLVVEKTVSHLKLYIRSKTIRSSRVQAVIFAGIFLKMSAAQCKSKVAVLPGFCLHGANLQEHKQTP
jgi:hypothetical protein